MPPEILSQIHVNGKKAEINMDGLVDEKGHALGEVPDKSLRFKIIHEKPFFIEEDQKADGTKGVGRKTEHILDDPNLLDLVKEINISNQGKSHVAVVRKGEDVIFHVVPRF